MVFTMTKQAQDAPSFEEYAATAWPWLYRCSYLLAGNHADAEDLAQQTLLQAYRSWGKVSRADQPKAYLRRMLTNLHISQHRPRSSQARAAHRRTARAPLRPARGTRGADGAVAAHRLAPTTAARGDRAALLRGAERARDRGRARLLHRQRQVHGPPRTPRPASRHRPRGPGSPGTPTKPTKPRKGARSEMSTELEKTLARELNEVADGVLVPPMPALPSDEVRQPLVTRIWQPLLVAAAAVLVVGGLAVVVGRPGDAPPPTDRPTQGGPTPSVPEDGTISTCRRCRRCRRTRSGQPLVTRVWQPLLVAAAAVLVVGGLALVVGRPADAPPPTDRPTRGEATPSVPQDRTISTRPRRCPTSSTSGSSSTARSCPAPGGASSRAGGPGWRSRRTAPGGPVARAGTPTRSPPSSTSRR